MGKINKILVPVDGSVNGCKATDEAIFFAEKCKADLDFVYVASNINKDIPSHIVFDRIWEKLPDDLKASKHVETGSIPKAILRVAAQEHSDMIIMGSRGLGLFKGALIGSVSQKVVEESPIPVMVIKCSDAYVKGAPGSMPGAPFACAILFCGGLASGSA